MTGIWAPCLRMSRHKIFPPIKVKSAQGGWLYTDTGSKIFDATSSWWCKHLGHRHPQIINAMHEQSKKYIHAIGANTYSEAIYELSKKLTSIYPELNKVSYASDGSSAVEIAIKMSLHTRKIINQNDKRTGIIKLAGAYHGETILAMSVSDCEMYRSDYKDILIDTHTCPVPASCKGPSDPKWHNAEESWQQTKQHLEKLADKSAVIIIEPLLQAANCMHIYSKDWLTRLMQWAQSESIDIIFDEIMTGFWRTGKYMALDYTGITPDFVCLGKGLSAGSIPLSAVLASQKRFDACYPPSGLEQPFLHSHTYSAHALGAAVANAALEIYNSDTIKQNILQLTKLLPGCLEHSGLTNHRSIGCIVAADLINEIEPAEIQKIAAANGILIRPLGNTLYICPPITTSIGELEHIKSAIAKTLNCVV